MSCPYGERFWIDNFAVGEGFKPSPTKDNYILDIFEPQNAIEQRISV
jgi:hypothetical protein